MQAYQDNGVRQGWLINPQDQAVEIYRPNQGQVVLTQPNTLNGNDVLSKCTLDLSKIWEYTIAIPSRIQYV